MATLRYSSVDIDLLSPPYAGRLINEPEVTTRFLETFWGVVEASEITLELGNADGALTATLYTQDLRGRPLTVSRYDAIGAVTVEKWNGVVSQVTLNPGRVVVRGTNVNTTVFETQVPKGTISTDDWPLAKDVGMAVPVVLGTVTKVPLPYVKDDVANDVYEYLISRGAVSATAFYRGMANGMLSVVETNRTVTRDNVTTTTSTGAAEKTWTHTCLGSDRCLLVGVAIKGAETVSSITYNLVPLTKVDHAANGTSERVEWWYLLNPPRGSYTVALALSAAATVVALSVSYRGVKQTMVTGDFAFMGATGSDAAPTVTVSAATGELVVDLVGVAAEKTVTEGTGQSKAGSQKIASQTVAAVSQEVGAASVAMTWALSGAAAWASAGVRLQPEVAYVVDSATYSGLTVLRFRVRQSDFGGGLHPIYADVTGLPDERNPARAIRALLSDTTWGLGQTVDATSFDAAEAAVTLVGGLYTDGVLGGFRGQVQAQDVLRELMLVRGMRLKMTSAGAWGLSVDSQQSLIRLHARDGAGEGERTLFSCQGRQRPPLADMVSDVVIRYRYDAPAGRLLHPARRTVHAGQGRERPYDLYFVRDHTTADKVADYLGKRLRLGEEALQVTLPLEARRLTEGDLVQVTYAPLGIANEVYEVADVSERLTSISAGLRYWDPTWYAYDPAPLPPDAVLGSADDYSRIPPSPVTGLAVADTETVQAADGTWTATVTLTFTTPESNYAKSSLWYRPTGSIAWTPGGETTAQGTNLLVPLAGLVVGQSYDYLVEVVNAFGLVSAANPMLTAQAAPTPATGPPAPSALTATQGGGLVVIVLVTAATPTNWATTRLYRHTTNDSGAATLLTQAKSLSFADNAVAYGTEYYYWARVVDSVGNVSDWSPVASVTPVRIQDGDLENPPAGPGAEHSLTQVVTLTVEAQSYKLHFTIPHTAKGVGFTASTPSDDTGCSAYLGNRTWETQDTDDQRVVIVKPATGTSQTWTVTLTYS